MEVGVDAALTRTLDNESIAIVSANNKKLFFDIF